MDEFFAAFLEEFGPQIDKVQPAASEIEKSRGTVPEILLAYWNEHGWGGFYHGLFWLTNPDALAEVTQV